MLEESKNIVAECIHMAIAVIYGADNQILLARHLRNKDSSGLWDFPGSKIEPDETTIEALARELEEELGIMPVTVKPLITVSHNYPEKTVVLHVHRVLAFSGNPKSRVNKELAWVKPSQLSEYNFLPENRAVVSGIHLPDQYAITGQFSDYDDLVRRVTLQLEQGIRLIQFRANMLDESTYMNYAKKLTELCNQFNAQLIIKADPMLLKQGWCDGVHVRAKEAMKLYKAAWCCKRAAKRKWFSVSCHNLKEIKIAEAIGADFVTLSPVCLTQTHLEAVPLGFSLAAKITSQAGIPVYWQGGIQRNQSRRVMEAEGQGIASISTFWPE